MYLCTVRKYVRAVNIYRNFFNHNKMRKLNGILRVLKPFISSTLYRQYSNGMNQNQIQSNFIQKYIELNSLNIFLLSAVNQTNGGLIAVDKFKAVTILSINRPDKQNAMNEALLNELATHLTQFENDVDARAIVLHGIGGNFSVGYDTDELKQKCQQNKDTLRRSLFVSYSIESKLPEIFPTL